MITKLILNILCIISEKNPIKFRRKRLLPITGPRLFMAIATKRGEICLGIKIKDEELSHGKNYGVRLIPPKNELLQLSKEDSLIVLAEDDT